MLVFMLVYWVRFSLPISFLEVMHLSRAPVLPIQSYLLSGFVMGIIEIILLQSYGVYRKAYGLAHIEEFAWILRSSFIAMIVTFAFTLASGQLYYSRFVLLFAFPTVSIALSGWHNCYHLISRRVAIKKERTIRIAFYGTSGTAKNLTRFIQSRSIVPYEIIGYIKPRRDSQTDEFPSVCSRDEMFDWLIDNSVSELFIADTKISKEDKAEIIYACEQHDLGYKLVADIFSLVSITTRVIHMGGITMIESVPPPLSGVRILVKRVMDMIISTILIILFIPIWFILSIIIAVTSGFPIFFKQKRLGRGNILFNMIKFRSMHMGAHGKRNVLSKQNESTGPLFKIKNDPRVTGIGKFLRRWSLDELPQLLNVLTGKMSLVGPRPPLPEEVEEYSRQDIKRLYTVPGITGVWQISGRSDLTFDEMIKLDLYYIDNWSIWLDISILILTIPAILFRRGAY